MPVDAEKYLELVQELGPAVNLVAVSKTKSVEEIMQVYNLGQRDFGENYVQELLSKQALLPRDIRWHFIGHLQSNKVKLIAPFVHLIHAADSLKLLQEINRQAGKNGRRLDCLLQVHISDEETKFGFDPAEWTGLLSDLAASKLPMVGIKGLMGMASFTPDEEKIRSEFRVLKNLYDQVPDWSILSMGMTSDYRLAIAEGSNMVRIGSLIFGERSKPG